MDDTEVFRLSFLFPHETREQFPTITLTFKESLLKPLLEWFEKRNTHSEFLAATKKYLADDAEFQELEADLFGNSSFGYGRTVSVMISGDQITLGIMIMSSKYSQHSGLMLHYILNFLQGNHEPAMFLSNRKQRISLYTAASLGEVRKAHAVAGFIGKEVIKWLSTYTESSPDGMPLPAVVRDAMQNSWHFCSMSHEGQAMPDECRALVTGDGRFFFGCFGDATDLAIYPDLDYQKGREFAEFSCHNLDAAEQQLALVSGLAMLYRLVEEDA